jgi:hypothetical protein
MPKSSGSEMKVIRHPEPPAPKSRPIMDFAAPPPAPPMPSQKSAAASNELAAETIRKANNPGEIDPRQRRD